MARGPHLFMISNVLKFIGYVVELVEALKKVAADLRMKKANAKAEGGDQRDIEKELNPDEPGPTRFKYLGLFTRSRKKPD